LNLKQLFKYLSAPRDLFEDGFIRLTQPAALNDPFEASFCRKSLDELTSHFDDAMALDPEFGEIPFSQYIENRMHHIGIVSLSETKENLLMWAHYANEHKGLVVGIADFPRESIFHSLFRADTLINSSCGEEWSPFNGKPKPVSYRKGLRYRNDKFDYDYSNISAEGADRMLYDIFMQKSEEWIYEQEHRVVLRVEQADRVFVPNIDHVANTRIRERIKSSAYASAGGTKDSCIVDLLNIEDEAERVAVAIELGKLSRNPKTLYLMRLSSSAINSCLLGLKSTLSKSDVQGKHACSTGCLDIWRAKKNEDYYSLEFEQI
jgi:hypothetical protein